MVIAVVITTDAKVGKSMRLVWLLPGLFPAFGLDPQRPSVKGRQDLELEGATSNTLINHHHESQWHRRQAYQTLMWHDLLDEAECLVRRRPLFK